MAKRYARVNWQNKPSTATPWSAQNLNKMDKGIDDCDNAVEDLYSVKLNAANIANNVITTAAGLALDARQGPVIQGQINAINNNLALKTQTLVSANFPDIKVTKYGSVLNFNMVGGAKTALVNNTAYTIGNLNAGMLPSQTIVKHFRINITTQAYIQIAGAVVSIYLFGDIPITTGIYLAETFI